MIDGPGSVLVPCFQQGGRELGLVDRVRKILGLKTERVAVIIVGTAPSPASHPAGNWLYKTGFRAGPYNIPARGRWPGPWPLQPGPVLLLPYPAPSCGHILSEYQGLKISAYIPSNGLHLRKVHGSSSHRSNLSRGMDTSSAGVYRDALSHTSCFITSPLSCPARLK